jgi:peptide/nickel transport system permease protein
MMVVLLCITTITFILSRVIPADPAAAAAGVGATREQIAALTHKMGFDQPLTTQYVTYLKGLLHLNLGTSVSTGNQVTKDLATYLPATFELVVVSFVVYLVAAVGLGLLAARFRGGVVDGIIRVFSIISSAAPVFWIALLLQLIFYARLGWLPSGGRLGTADLPPPTITGFYTIDSLLHGDIPLFLVALQHLALPVVAIVLSMLGVGVRLIRASVTTEMNEHYVRTAEAKGLRPNRILIRHILKNALNPFVSMAGIQLGYLFAWIILVETIVQWPGIGLYAYQSFQSLDYNPIMGITLVISLLFVIINFLTDLIYPMLDPRVRHA